LSRNTENNATTQVAGDFIVTCATRAAAQALAAAGHPTYLYSFVHQPGESVNWPSGTRHLGAFHGAEIVSGGGAFRSCRSGRFHAD
jgi:carboxylesterase type B